MGTLRDSLHAQYLSYLGTDAERLGRRLFEALKWSGEQTFDAKSWLEQKAWMEEGCKQGDEGIVALETKNEQLKGKA